VGWISDAEFAAQGILKRCDFWIWIDGDNLSDGVGKRDCDGVGTASQIQDAHALAEVVTLDNEIDRRLRIWRTETVVIRRRAGERRALAKLAFT
jgi:hypothetical protein